MEDNFDTLFKQYLRKAKWANKNIERINAKFGEDSWAVGKLKARMQTRLYNGWENGRVSLSAPKDIKELRARLSALENFEKSKTHTVTGINKVRRKVKKMLREKLKDKKFEPTEEEIEKYYEMLADNDVQFFISRMGASQFYVEIQDARNNNDTLTQFYDRFMHYFEEDSVDDDFTDALIRIYKRLIVGEED